MAKSTATNKTLINPVFGVPRGAEDQFVVTDESVFPNPEVITQLEEFAENESVEEGGEVPDFNDEERLDIPTDFVVFSQTLRRAPGGQQVVDVLIDAEDVSGAINYEFNVVKV